MQQAYKGNSKAFLDKLNELTLALCQHGDKEAAGLHFIWALAKDHPKVNGLNKLYVKAVFQ